MKSLNAAVILAAAWLLTACSKADEAVAQNPGPDNAVTRYAENLVQSEKKAQDVANNANAVIAAQQQQMHQSVEQSQ